MAFSQMLNRRFPVLLQDLTSTFDTDPAVAAQQGLKPTQVQVYVQEEQSKDTETRHDAESLSVFVAE